MGNQAAAGRDRRKHTRIKTSLPGRYLLADRREGKCTITDASPGGVAVETTQRVAVGETVIIYVDQIGRVEGRIARVLKDGFALQLRDSEWVAKKIASRLSELRMVRRPLTRP
jgi:hypothetical protein